MNDMLSENRVILKDVMRAAGQALAAEHELSFKLLKGRFNRGQFKMVLQFGVPVIEEEMRLDFCRRIAPRLGFPEDIIGQQYTVDGRTFTIVDINPELNYKCMRVIEVGTEGPRLRTTPGRIREALGLPDPHSEEEEAETQGDVPD